jgi:hypothetical protein
MSNVEGGWVIELGESLPSVPQYWMGPSSAPSEFPFGIWTIHHNNATRFARQGDAQAVANTMKILSKSNPRAHFRVAYHEWG